MQMFIVIILAFIFQVLSGLSDIFIIFSSYLIFKQKNKEDYILLDKLLINMYIVYIASLTSSAAMLFLNDFFEYQGYGTIIFQESIKFLLFFLIFIVYKKLDVEYYFERFSSKNTSFFLIYLFLVTLLISYSSHYYQIFDQFIFGVILFLVIQTTCVVYFFYRLFLNQKEKYKDSFKEQELIHLKQYTDQLESNQEKIAKFRHDYKNLLLSLKSLSTTNADQELFEQVKQLEEYSKSYIDTNDFDSKHFRNIKNSYLKSFMIAKFHKASEENIQCKFECLEKIEEIPIPIFDCIRMLGIILDNSIEATIECEKKSLSMMVYQDNHQMEFLIENSYLDTGLPVNKLIDKGVSTKNNHQGLGLNTIEDINKKNNNMFVQYVKGVENFSTQIILIRKE